MVKAESDWPESVEMGVFRHSLCCISLSYFCGWEKEMKKERQLLLLIHSPAKKGLWVISHS
jgi:hypothetical protein